MNFASPFDVQCQAVMHTFSAGSQPRVFIGLPLFCSPDLRMAFRRVASQLSASFFTTGLFFWEGPPCGVETCGTSTNDREPSDERTVTLMARSSSSVSHET